MTGYPGYSPRRSGALTVDQSDGGNQKRIIEREALANNEIIIENGLADRKGKEMKLKTQYYRCSKCNGIVRFDGNICENCGAPLNHRETILNNNTNLFNKSIVNETRVYYNLTGREKEAIKTFIVNSTTDFRIKNMTLIQQNWQLQKPVEIELWNSVAKSVIQ